MNIQRKPNIPVGLRCGGHHLNRCLLLLVLVCTPLAAQVKSNDGTAQRGAPRIPSSLTFATPSEVGAASAEVQMLTVTNNTGADITFPVEFMTDGPAGGDCNNSRTTVCGMPQGAFLETGSAVVLRNNPANTCQPLRFRSTNLANGASCQVPVYLMAQTEGAVTGSVRVAWIPKPSVAISSVSYSNGTMTVVTATPVGGLDGASIGRYMTVVDVADNYASLNYNSTWRIKTVTDSQHFTLDMSGERIFLGGCCASHTNTGYVSVPYAHPWGDADWAGVLTVKVNGMGAAEPRGWDVDHPVLPKGISFANETYTGTVMDTHYTKPNACSGAVVAEAKTLTDRLANAQCGEVICVPAGAAITGSNFKLKNIPGCRQYTYLITSDLAATGAGGAIPPGRRVNPATDLPHMGKIVLNGQSPMMQMEPAAGYWRVVGIAFARVNNYPLTGAWGGVYSANVAQPATSSSTINHHIIWDRIMVTRDPLDTYPRNMNGGVVLDANYAALIDSWVDSVGYGEVQAVAGGCNGNGPVKVVNNHLEASGEVLIFGGCDPRWIGSVTQDVEIRGNLLHRPPDWMRKTFDGTWPGTAMKNLLEFKTCVRCLVTGNILEYNWPGGGQLGEAILFSSGNQNGSGIFTRIAEITMDYNLLRHSFSGMNITATSFAHPNGYTKGIIVRNLLYQDVGGVNSQWFDHNSRYWSQCISRACGHPAQLSGGKLGKYGPSVPLRRIWFDHFNFVVSSAEGFSLDSPNHPLMPHQGALDLTVTNGILHRANYGTAKCPNAVWDFFVVSPKIQQTLLAGPSSSASLPPNDCHHELQTDPSGSKRQAFWGHDETAMSSLFTDWTNCQNGSSVLACRLAPGSIYRGDCAGRGCKKGTDGKDLGPDIVTLHDRLACIATGTCNPLP